MKRGDLARYFTAVASKRLARVEIDLETSHQHELNGVQPLIALFGRQRLEVEASFMRLTDDDERAIRSEARITWYDSRENHPTRTEFRLYFTGNDAMDAAQEGDLLIVALTRDGRALLVVTEAHSTIEAQLTWLFAIGDAPGNQFAFADMSLGGTDDRLDLVAQALLQEIGIEATPVDDSALGSLIDAFHGQFPTTKEFSAFARASAGTDRTDGPDELIVNWMHREEVLFRTLERHIVVERLQLGFGDDVDEFVKFSLSVQNRRKSRAGLAFEHHLRYLLDVRQIRYGWHVETELGSTPDFLFPGASEYHDSSYPRTRLRMLAVKLSCKDRWRQVLAEADQIEIKHLLTLEPRISTRQTAEMDRHKLRLVVPTAIQATYEDSQRPKLISVADFIASVQAA